ncbi:MAG TPA: hypothetical protein VF691_05905 [Cytophagaceae bacterium]|jgi:hypothetical protein
MMYDPYSFSANGQPTITKKDGAVYNVQRSNTSNGDLNGVLKIYPYTSDNSVKPIYEFYSSTQTDHFYSRVFAVIQNYAFSTICFYAHTAQVSGSVPVYRFYSATLGDHYYSISNAIPDGYIYDGVEFYAYNAQSSVRVPIYRYYNASIANNYYSSGQTGPVGYEAKGIAFYAFPKR